MREFEAKKPSSNYVYAVGFSLMLPAGVTILTYDLEISIYDKSKVTSDPDILDMKDGSVSLNTDPVTIEGITHPANTALLCNIKAGVIGCKYVTSWAPVFSDGQTPVEDVLLPVEKYEPQ